MVRVSLRASMVDRWMRLDVRSMPSVGSGGVASGCVVFRFGSGREVNYSIPFTRCGATKGRVLIIKTMYVYIACRRRCAVRRSGVGVGASDFSGDDDARDEIA